MSFTVHTLETAPAASRETLEATQKAYGFLPNLMGVLAESPAAAAAYLGVAGALKHATLSPAEQQVVAIAVSAENDCAYCVAAHSTIAKGTKLAADELVRLRDQQPLADAKLEALRRFALAVVRERGRVAEGELKTFFAAGYDRAALLDVLAVVTLKTLSNYANHIAETPVDTAFAAQAWQGAVAAVGG